MKVNINQKKVTSDLLKEVESISDQVLSDCYQCGKCSAGCPIAFQMDYPPNQINRMVKLGMGDLALNSKTIWLCASCETCTTRCPREVDLATVMDAIRIIAVRRGIKPKVRTVRLFNKLFLGIIRKYGRMFEMELIMKYKLFSGNFFQDVFKAPVLFLKGRMKLLPTLSNRKEMRRIFKAIEKKRKEKAKSEGKR